MLNVAKRKASKTRYMTIPAVFTNMVELNDISDVNYGVLVILALSSLTVYGLIIAG
jgi:NADH:ubiquinone oxidoreductase subunit H